MIIDCHCHAGKGDGLTGPWDTAAPLDKYLRWAAKAGIDRTVHLRGVPFRLCGRQPRGGGHRREPAAIASTDWPSFTPPGTAAGCGDLVQVAVEQYGFVGIKVHRHDARLTREICDVARAFRAARPL